MRPARRVTSREDDGGAGPREPGAVAPRPQEAGLDGPSCTELKLDRRDGTYKLLEVKGRHNRSSLLSTASGINFPWIGFRHRTAGERPGRTRAREGLSWIDEMQELRYAITAAGRDGAGLRDLARPGLREHVFAVVDPRDPAPFARELDWMRRRGCARGATCGRGPDRTAVACRSTRRGVARSRLSRAAARGRCAS